MATFSQIFGQQLYIVDHIYDNLCSSTPHVRSLYVQIHGDRLYLPRLHPIRYCLSETGLSGASAYRDNMIMIFERSAPHDHATSEKLVILILNHLRIA